MGPLILCMRVPSICVPLTVAGQNLFQMMFREEHVWLIGPDAGMNDVPLFSGGEIDPRHFRAPRVRRNAAGAKKHNSIAFDRRRQRGNFPREQFAVFTEAKQRRAGTPFRRLPPAACAGKLNASVDRRENA